MGFGADISGKLNRTQGELLKDVQAEDLLKCGLISEVISRLPVVAPRVGGLPELLAEAPGTLYESGRLDELAAALVEWLDAPPEVADTARRGALDHYSITHVGNRLEDIYAGVTGGPTR